MIPQLVHRTVPTDTTDEVEEWWQRWKLANDELHGYSFRTWRDPLDADDFPLTAACWPLCTSGAQLAGLVRLEALWHHGGIYLDSDIEPVPGARLDPILHVGPVVVCTEDGQHLTDAFIAAEPGHAAVAAAIDRAVRLMLDAGDGHVPNAQQTGPLNLTEAWRGRADVTVLASRVFYPVHYTDRHRYVAARTLRDSIGVHRWHFSWQGT